MHAIGSSSFKSFQPLVASRNSCKKLQQVYQTLPVQGERMLNECDRRWKFEVPEKPEVRQRDPWRGLDSGVALALRRAALPLLSRSGVPITCRIERWLWGGLLRATHECGKAKYPQLVVPVSPPGRDFVGSVAQHQDLIRRDIGASVRYGVQVPRGTYNPIILHALRHLAHAPFSLVTPENSRSTTLRDEVSKVLLVPRRRNV